MSRILVTGSNGQLGSELRELQQQFNAIMFFTDYEALDITNESAVEQFIIENEINLIINCAAYTAVDKAEEDEILADSINHLAVANFAHISKERNIKLIHVSTDYVFDGEHFKPYEENHTPNPKNVYGITKFKGEEAILKLNIPNSFIIRTSWVYSSYGANFVKTMLRLGAKRDTLGIISDQVGSPTYAADLAKAILELSKEDVTQDKTEILHFSNEGVCSWYDFAHAIFELSEIEIELSAIPTSAYPTPASRPHFSLMSKEKIKNNYGIIVPYWKDSLRKCLIKIKEQSHEALSSRP